MNRRMTRRILTQRIIIRALEQRRWFSKTDEEFEQVNEAIERAEIELLKLLKWPNYKTEPPVGRLTPSSEAE